MYEQTNSFLADWKRMADIDDGLALEVDLLVRRIRRLYELKQQAYAASHDILDFQLGVMLRKKRPKQNTDSQQPNVCLEIGLLNAFTTDSSRKSYFNAAALLSDALRESRDEKKLSEKISIKFQRRRKLS